MAIASWKDRIITNALLSDLSELYNVSCDSDDNKEVEFIIVEVTTEPFFNERIKRRT
jgi:hypothetical protein